MIIFLIWRSFQAVDLTTDTDFTLNELPHFSSTWARDQNKYETFTSDKAICYDVKLWLYDYVIMITWLWLCDYDYVIMIVWLWLCDYDYVIMITWLWLCDYDYVIMIVWLWLCDYDCVIMIMWLWLCDYDCVIMIVWLWLCDYDCVIMHMLWWGRKSGNAICGNI